MAKVQPAFSICEGPCLVFSLLGPLLLLLVSTSSPCYLLQLLPLCLVASWSIW